MNLMDLPKYENSKVTHEQTVELHKLLVQTVIDFFKKENRNLNSENDRLRAKIRAYDEVISSHDLSPFFHRECEKEKAREDER